MLFQILADGLGHYHCNIQLFAPHKSGRFCPTASRRRLRISKYISLLTLQPCGINSKWTITFQSKNTTSMTFPFDLSRQSFCLLDDLEDIHSDKRRLDWRSYRKHQVSSPVITLFNKSGSRVPTITRLSDFQHVGNFKSSVYI